MATLMTAGCTTEASPPTTHDKPTKVLMNYDNEAKNDKDGRIKLAGRESMILFSKPTISL